MSFWDANIAGGNKPKQPQTNPYPAGTPEWTNYAQNATSGFSSTGGATKVGTQPSTGWQAGPYTGSDPIQATSAPKSYNSGPIDPRVNQLTQDYIQQNGLQANQSDPTSLNKITEYLRSQGVDAQTDYTDSNGHTGGILVNGMPYQLINGSNQWTQVQPWEQSSGGGAGAGAGFFGPGGYQGNSSLTYSPWQRDPRNQTLWDTLMGRSQQSLIPTPDNPVIKAQTDAFRAEQERGSRNYLNDLAEKAGPLANNSTEARMAHEQAAQNTANMQGQLLQNEVNARRTEISQALQQMGGLLSDDQRLALQKELAYLENDQFLRNLSLNAEDRASYWDALRSGLLG